MPIALLFALALQQTAPVLTWSEPPPRVAEDVAPEMTGEEAPAHALTDPYAWERSQCSPYIRKDEPLAECQARVRSMLAVAMADKLPDGLRPDALENCSNYQTASGYQFQCGRPRTVASMAPSAPVERVCDNRPERAGNSLAFNTRCQPVGGDGEAGLRFRLNRD